MKAALFTLTLLLCFALALAVPIGISGSAPSSIQHKGEAKGNPLECSVCTLVVNYVVSELEKNSTETEIIHLLEDFCRILPVARPECDSLVSEYGMIIIKMLIEDAEADACKIIGACSSSSSSVKASPSKQQHKEGKVSGAIECSVCTLLANYVLKDIESNKTESEIITDMDAFCKALPVGKSECTTIVGQYGPTIIDMLLNNASAEVCDVLGLCSSSVSVGRVAEHKGASVQGSPIECSVCTLLANYVVKQIESNATESEIVGALDDFCKILPVAKSECEAIVGQYGPMMVQMLLNNASAEVCADLGLCSPSLSAGPSGVRATCEQLVAAGQRVIAEHKTAGAILSSPVWKKNQSVVEKYGKQILHFVLSGRGASSCKTLA